MVKAAIYTRISSDDGEALGVQRQAQDCRKLADDLGWEVVEVYEDNDVSAFSGKRRPAYEAMLADIGDGEAEAVLCYHPDRLHRRPIEFEQFVEAMTAAGVAEVRFVSGGALDVLKGDGLALMRVQGVIAAEESAAKSRRVRRAYEQIAAAGLPHMGGPRPFGYDDDKMHTRPDEAAVVVELVDRFLAGESLGSLTKWLDAEGVRTPYGKPWRTSTVRTLISSPRIAGLRAHRGVVVGPGVWEPIISEAKRDQVVALIEQRKVTGRRAPRRYLLSGLCRCGRCGSRLYSMRRETSRRYVCSSGADFDGCGRLTVVAEPVEALIADAVLYRLDTPELADALAGKTTDPSEQTQLAEELAADQRKLEELTDLYAANAISAPEWKRARDQVDARITKTKRALARRSGHDALVPLVGDGEGLRQRWADMDLTAQAAVISAVVDHIVIAPGTPGARTVDPARVQPVWKL